MAEFKVIETQEELDKIIQDRLNRQKETLEKQFANYDQLKARKTELETEVGNLQAAINDATEKEKTHDGTISELNAKIAGFETTNLRTRIALQNGVPFEFADRLVGEDEESLTADAQRFAGIIKPVAPVPPLKDTEPSIADGVTGAYKSLIENINLEGE